MRRRITRIAFLILVGMVMLGAWSAATSMPAHAQDCTALAGEACIASVSPAVFDTSVSNTFTISGDGFTTSIQGNNPRVIIDGAITYGVTVVSNTALRFTVPANSLSSFGESGHTYVLDVSDNAMTTVEGGPLAIQAQGIVPTGTPTPQPTAFVRPLVVALNYGPSTTSPIRPGQTFDVEVNIVNTGPLSAYNTVVVFFPGDFEPRTTGGVRSEGILHPGEVRKIIQPLTAKKDLETGLGLLDIEIRYTDEYGTGYTEKIRITLDVFSPTQAGTGPGATRTPTPGVADRPQLVIGTYDTNIDPLTPGSIFDLQLGVINTGTGTAKAVTMIVGGGSSGSDNGTPGAGGGGVSGSGGEFTNFAPINSSNVQAIGDVPAGTTIQPTQALIVNSTTKPGAYSLKISFVYSDEKGGRFTDDQVITLLVLQPPRVSVSFYRPPDPLFVGQPGMLPIQVVNTGNTSTVLGMMTVTAEGAEMINNTLLVGNLDPGFPITLDAMAVPSQPGPLTINIVIDYVNDFNQSQTIEQELTVEVLDAPPIDPNFPPDGEGFPDEFPTQPETIWQKILRFFRGLFGLGSEPSQPGGMGGGFPDEGFPEEGIPQEGFPQEGVPVPVPSGGKTGG